MARRVRIAGMGVVSPIGVGVEETLASLIAGRGGIGLPRHCATALGVPVGEVRLTDNELRDSLGTQARSRTALLATAAASEAATDANLTKAELAHAAIISATTVGGMDQTPKFYNEFVKDSSLGLLRHIAEHPCASHTDTVAKALGIGGWRTTISTACSSGANAIMTGARMIECGMADTVIAGGADALCAFTLGGFNALKILSREACHPLSAERDGLNLGEGAAYLVLKADDGPTGRGWMAGWRNANDAHHQTALSDNGQGAQDAMRGAMEKAGIGPQDVGYVNLHGTATPNNDRSEMAAIEAVWAGRALPRFSSTKGLTGHTLAAAGAIEAVICLLALQNQTAWRNTGLLTPMSADAPMPTTENAPFDARFALSNSLGFGGNCTSLIFQKA